MPGKVESLPLLPTPLLELEGTVSPLCCRPRSWSKLGEPLHQTERIGPNHSDTQSPPDLSHHLAELSWTRLPPLGSAHSSNLRLGKHEEKLVQIRREISLGSGHQLPILQPSKVTKPCHQRTWCRLQLASPPLSCTVEPDIVIVQLHLVLVEMMVSESQILTILALHGWYRLMPYDGVDSDY